jgi:hypothetical protein
MEPRRWALRPGRIPPLSRAPRGSPSLSADPAAATAGFRIPLSLIGLPLPLGIGGLQRARAAEHAHPPFPHHPFATRATPAQQHHPGELGGLLLPFPGAADPGQVFPCLKVGPIEGAHEDPLPFREPCGRTEQDQAPADPGPCGRLGRRTPEIGPPSDGLGQGWGESEQQGQGGEVGHHVGCCAARALWREWRVEARLPVRN